MEIPDNKTTTPSFLHVTNTALPRDNGVYTLRANNSIGEAYCSVIVMIGEIDRTPIYRDARVKGFPGKSGCPAPTFVTGLQSAQVKEGRPYTIQFVVSGRKILLRACVPKPEVTLRNTVTGDTIPIVASDTTDGSTTYNHVIDSFDVADVAEYVAVATNELGTVSSRGTLNIDLARRSPVFMEAPENALLYQGEKHIIAATISSVPVSNIYVLDQNGRLMGDGVVTPMDKETTRYRLPLDGFTFIIPIIHDIPIRLYSHFIKWGGGHVNVNVS
eukprot:sb/3468106/